MTTPSSLEVEEALIGALITNPSAYHEAANHINTPDVFFFRRTKLFWETITELVNTAQPVQILLIDEKLKNNSDYQNIGGAGYLVQCISNAPSSSYVRVYAELIKIYYVRRQLIQKADEIKAVASDETSSIDELADLINEAQVIQSGMNIKRAEHISVHAQEHIDIIESRMENPGMHGYKTGLSGLDDIIHGMHKKSYTIIGGRPEHGKTATLLSAALNALKDGAKIGYMNVADGQAVDILGRLAGMESGVSSVKLREGSLSKEDWQRYLHAMDELSKLQMYIKSKTGMTIMDIESECKTLMDINGAKVHPDIIMIDYIQRVGYPGLQTQSFDCINAVSMKAVDMVKQFDCSIMMGAQLRRSESKDRPTESELKGSGNFAEDVDQVVLVFQPAKADPVCDNPDLIEYIVTKNRISSKYGVASCVIDRSSGRILSANMRTAHLGNVR